MNTPKGRVDLRTVRCPARNCRGALMDITPRLAEALGVKHVQCDRCGGKHAQRISGETP